MKKSIVASLILCLIVIWPVQAQEPIYLPLVMSSMTECKESWRIIVPNGTTNQVLNPSAETTGNFSAVGGGTATRETTESHYGLYSYQLVTAGGDEGISLTLSALTNTTHFVTLRVTGDLPPVWRWSLDNANYRAPTLIERIDGDWTLYGVSFPADQANGSTTLYIRQSGAGAGDFYIDGVQVEALTYWTTYCDGTQDGCSWLGTAHASVSERSAQSRAGGRVRDLWADYGFFVEKVVGAGSAPVDISTRSYSILPGGELSGSKTNERNFTLIGRFIGDSEEDLHDKRQKLIEELSIDTYTEAQAVRVRFSGASVQKQISAHYTGGLEGDLRTSYGPWQVESDSGWRNLDYWTERTSIQFMSPDPLWREVGESSALLDTNDSATVRLVAGRLADTGQWDDLGPPNAAGTYTSVQAVLVASDGTVYFGGDFLNFDNIAAADYIVQYTPSTGTYAALGSGLNAAVKDIKEGPDGTIYIAGEFTNAGGDADADYFCQWNGTAFSAVGVPDAGTAVIAEARKILVAPDGNIYVVGDFLNWADVANADNIAVWDGAAWGAVGTGLNDVGYDVKMRNDILHACGAFTQAGGNAANRVAQFDGSDWSALGDGFNSIVFAILFDQAGLLYAGGQFTLSGTETMRRLGVWNGVSWSEVGGGLNAGGAYSLAIGADSKIFIGGSFTQAGDVALADRVTAWNGASFSHLDINLPDTPIVYDIDIGNSDPVVNRTYDVWLGFDTTGSASFAGTVTITNDGSQPAFPRIIVTRSSGTTATLETVRNETTGKELLTDYDLLDGETLTINLAPTAKSITSSLFGNRLDAVLANSDFGTWSLQPDDNDVTSFINVSGDPTVVGYLLWRDSFLSLD